MSGGYKQVSLTMAVNNARKHKATHILFIDCDMIFPPDGIKRLIELDKDVVGASYNEKRFPLVSTVKVADEKGNLIVGNMDAYKDPFKVYALGFGFMLCKMSIFDKIEKPYFNSPIDENDTFTTDDFYFCDKLQKAGVEVWCDPTLKVLHEGFFQY